MNRRHFLIAGALLSLDIILSGCVVQPRKIALPKCKCYKPIPSPVEVCQEEPLEEIVEICPETEEKQDLQEKIINPISPEYRALLDTIAWAEGTGCYYNMMFGRTLFTDFSAHPVETGEMPKKGFPFGPRWRRNSSTAAGRYQFLYKTYLKLKEEGLFQNGFTPEEQDKAALYLINLNGVTQESLDEAIRKKEFKEIWNALSPEWASLPQSKTGRSKYRRQYAYDSKELKKVFFYSYKLQLGKR